MEQQLYHQKPHIHSIVKGRKADVEGTLASIGNGKMCVYTQGAEMYQTLGPYYSSPTFCHMNMVEDLPIESQRMMGTAIWQHKIGQGGDRYTFDEFTVGDLPAYMRRFAGERKSQWKLYKSDNEADCFRAISKDLLAGKGFKDAFLMDFPRGAHFFYRCPIPDAIAIIVATRGDVTAVLSEEGKVIDLEIGKGEILFVTARTAALALKQLYTLADIPTDAMFQMSLSYWQDFTAKRLKNQPELREYTELDKRINEAVDDTATLIASQQDDGGGVLAGHNYHLAYVRDNYGVMRGLLAMGCYEQAERVVMYFSKHFDDYGIIKTAEGMGIYMLHEHENDFTENTGYLSLMPVDYYDITGDESIFARTLPMVMWAMDTQDEHLCNGALPFSGDETYIAGGVLDKAHIMDGSMEATMLYHRACERLLPILMAKKLISHSFFEKHNANKALIEKNFERYFVKDGILYCNLPGMYTYETAPATRAGGRECGHGFGTSYKTRNIRYVCLDCVDKNPLPKAEHKQYFLNSSALSPIYVGSTLVREEILYRTIDAICKSWLDSGVLPSRPEGGSTVGYDYGLLLYAIKKTGALPRQQKAYDTLLEKTLDIADPAGAWVEYYLNNKPYHTKCRPWESAVNIAGILLKPSCVI